VLNFFASWCANCDAELHTFGRVSSSARAVQFLGIDTDDASRSTAEQLVRAADIAYPIGVDLRGVVADRYLVAALPVTFFVAADGIVQGEVIGQVNEAQLRMWVTRLQREQR
jgi:thiol-disulfide isomerase/thioredoxin